MSKPLVAVVGSANMDLVIRCARIPRPGETLFGDDVSEVPGGKGANQAVAASRLGGDVRMVGRVGDDAFGGRLRDNLAAEGVDTERVLATTDSASGLATITVESSGENAIMVIPGANGRVTPADVEAAADTLTAAECVLLQLETPVETVLAAIDVARRGGARVVLDPAPAPSTFPAELLAVDVVCPNESEAEALLGQPITSPEAAVDAARGLLDLGPAAAIVTLGADGAAWARRAGGGAVETGRVDPFKIEAVDTTAAGDAFAGGLGVRLAGGADLAEAVRFGCAAGALAATRLGAQPGMPTLAEVQEML